MARPLDTLVIYGAGGHGLVVAETAAAQGWHVLGFWDDDPQVQAPAGWTRLSTAPAHGTGIQAHVAIGDGAARRRVTQRLVREGWRPATVIHPTSVLSRSAVLGDGVFVGALAVINGQAIVGEGVIVNSGAVLEHHCTVGPFSHIGPRSVVCGGARVGPGALIGAGAVVLPQRTVGAGAVVGGGAVVVRDVAEGTVVMGVPARPAANAVSG